MNCNCEPNVIDFNLNGGDNSPSFDVCVGKVELNGAKPDPVKRIQFDKYEDLPIPGNAQKLYVVVNENTIYRWDEESKDYISCGSATEIEIETDDITISKEENKIQINGFSIAENGTILKKVGNKLIYEPFYLKGDKNNGALKKVTLRADGTEHDSNMVYAKGGVALGHSGTIGVDGNSAGQHGTTIGQNTQVFGDNGLAGGSGAIVYASGGKAFGMNCKAGDAGSINDWSFPQAEGWNTQAVGRGAHAEGESTKANGYGAHSEGQNTQAMKNAAHAEGSGTQVHANAGHGEGVSTAVYAYGAHAEGNGAIAGDKANKDDTSKNGWNQGFCHAEGWFTIAYDKAAHAEGQNSQALAIAAHAEGGSTKALAPNSHSEGSNTEASGTGSHAEGYQTKATQQYAHAEGQHTTASGNGAHSEGGSTVASGNFSHAEGSGTTAAGTNSHATGNSTRALGDASLSAGVFSIATRYGSRSDGYGSIADGEFSHAEGNSYTSGRQTHAEGLSNIAGPTKKVVLADGIEYLIKFGISGYGLIILSLITKDGTSVTHPNDVNDQLDRTKIVVNGYTYTIQKKTSTETNWNIDDFRFLNNKVYYVPTNPDEKTNYNAHAEGSGTRATGENSHSNGFRTIADYANQFVAGYYNNNNKDNILEIGNGKLGLRQNAFSVHKDGYAEVQFQGETPHSVVIKSTIDRYLQKIEEYPQQTNGLYVYCNDPNGNVVLRGANPGQGANQIQMSDAYGRLHCASAFVSNGLKGLHALQANDLKIAPQHIALTDEEKTSWQNWLGLGDLNAALEAILGV